MLRFTRDRGPTDHKNTAFFERLCCILFGGLEGPFQGSWVVSVLLNLGAPSAHIHTHSYYAYISLYIYIYMYDLAWAL